MLYFDFYFDLKGIPHHQGKLLVITAKKLQNTALRVKNDHLISYFSRQNYSSLPVDMTQLHNFSAAPSHQHVGYYRTPNTIMDRSHYFTQPQ